MAELGNGAGRTVTAQVHADLIQGIVGDGKLVLQTGRQMEAAIIDNNTIRIFDGMIVTQGRFVYNEANTYDDFKIETGAQDVTRYDIIGYRLYKSNGEELCESFVKKDVGQYGTVEENVLRDGDEEIYIPMYKVKIVGISIEELIPMYDKVINGLDKAAGEGVAQARRILIEPFEGSADYKIEVDKNNSAYYPYLGLAVINARIKQSYINACTVDNQELIKFATANEVPASEKVPVTVSMNTNFTRRYSGMIDENGVIAVRSNTSYNPSKGGTYYYYISAIYLVERRA